MISQEAEKLLHSVFPALRDLPAPMRETVMAASREVSVPAGAGLLKTASRTARFLSGFCDECPYADFGGIGLSPEHVLDSRAQLSRKLRFCYSGTSINGRSLLARDGGVILCHDHDFAGGKFAPEDSSGL